VIGDPVGGLAVELPPVASTVSTVLFNEEH